MGKLAITGGEPIRKKRFDAWPIYTEKERQALEDVLTNHNWGGQPFPGKHGDAFPPESHGALLARLASFESRVPLVVPRELKGREHPAEPRSDG